MTDESSISSESTDQTKEYHFITGVSEILMQLKEDLDQIQNDLDAHSREVQKTILRSKELSEQGHASTWYIMPEIELTIKMKYIEYEEKVIENNDEKIIRRIQLIPARRKLKSIKNERG
jgi:hypothetical protein